MTLLAVDPGENIGLSWWTEDGRYVSKEVVSLDAFLGLLSDDINNDVPHISTIVYEDFKLRSMKALQQSGSRMPAARVIGAIELFGKVTGTPLYAQPVDGLYVGARHANVKLPRGHVKDDVSAYCHAAYWFVGQGILTPKYFR